MSVSSKFASSSKTLSVGSSTGAYTVTLAAGSFIGELKQQDSAPGGAMVIADDFFRPVLAQAGIDAIFVTATEAKKSLDALPELIERMRAAGAYRQTKLIAVGGGVVQDIVAFISSVYMRGIAWSYVPTTLLAMVDSCVGGKSSINVGAYKNLVGTFHPPQAVLVDAALAATLPPAAFAGGLVEAAKICFCRGGASFERHLGFNPAPAMPTESLEAMIENSLLAKKHFIEIDEFDRKERLLLNFGHTFGHALEGASAYGIPHGIAVGLGILCALEFKRGRGMVVDRAPGVSRLETHLRAMIRLLPGLDRMLCALDPEDVLERFASDKKHSPERYTMILVSTGGEVVLERIERTPEVQARLREAIVSALRQCAREHRS